MLAIPGCARAGLCALLSGAGHSILVVFFLPRAFKRSAYWVVMCVDNLKWLVRCVTGVGDGL